MKTGRAGLASRAVTQSLRCGGQGVVVCWCSPLLSTQDVSRRWTLGAGPACLARLERLGATVETQLLHPGGPRNRSPETPTPETLPRRTS